MAAEPRRISVCWVAALLGCIPGCGGGGASNDTSAPVVAQPTTAYWCRQPTAGFDALPTDKPLTQSHFVSVGNLASARAAHTETLLRDGTVLVVDGGKMDLDDLLVPTDTIEVFDPATGKFASMGHTLTAREFHTATPLPNGTVLIAGGSECDRTAEIYDPATGKVSATGSMTTSRSGHTATLLFDGRVLLVGGSTLSGGAVASAEIYDPSNGTFSAVGAMSASRSSHTATLLESGQVLVIGGSAHWIQGLTDSAARASAELFDPRTATFGPTGPMAAGRAGHTATMLEDGSVLVTGGANSTPLSTTERYDSRSGRFVSGPNMTTARTAQTATRLPSGKVLVVGGIPAIPTVYVGYAPTASAEIYDPLGAGTFVTAGGMAEGRFWHSAELLPDGRVLVIGGSRSNAPMFGDDVVSTAEDYS